MVLSSFAKFCLSGIFVILACASLAQAQTSEVVTPKAMRVAAENAVNAGYSRAALAMSEALLTRNSNDLFALLIKSRALRNLGQFKEAAATARTAWTLAESDEAKFQAAMLMAQARSSSGNRSVAQLWLRRAAEVAPSDDHRAIATRDFRYVRSRNPLSVELRFNVKPTNNINNGSVHDSTPLFGLPFEFQLSGAARALDGIEYFGGISARYRFAQSAVQAHDITVQASHRTYSMTDAARAMAPGVSGRDFAFSSLAAGYEFQRTPKKGLGPYALNITAGQTWYAALPYNHFVRLGGTQNVKLGTSFSLSLSGALERQFSDTGGADIDSFRGDVQLGYRLGELGVARLTVSNTTSRSDDDFAQFDEWRSGVAFSFAKPVLGSYVSFGIDARQRDYERSRYDPTGRNDLELSAHADVVFHQIDKFGFNPTLRVEYSQTESNIGLFDNNRFGIQFGIRSAF